MPDIMTNGTYGQYFTQPMPASLLGSLGAFENQPGTSQFGPFGAGPFGQISGNVGSLPGIVGQQAFGNPQQALNLQLAAQQQIALQQQATAQQQLAAHQQQV